MRLIDRFAFRIRQELEDPIWLEVDKRRDLMLRLGAGLPVVLLVDELVRVILGSMSDPTWCVDPKARGAWLLEEIAKIAKRLEEVLDGRT